MTKPFLVFNRDPATGARPGLVQGETYTTDKEVERNKYEVLESYSATYLKELEGAQTEPGPDGDDSGPKPEPETTPEPETEPEPTDQGLAKDYPGTGWYKATDTGIVYNKDVPEGETHTFDGDPIEYISVWRNEGFNPETFTGTLEDAQKLVDWYKNLHRCATSNVTDMSNWMFGYGESEGLVEMGISPDDIPTGPVDISHYDTSNVTNMSAMFGGVKSFNQPLDNFDTSNVTNMTDMFSNATSFDQPLDNFDTSNVTDMGGMFSNASSFNQPLDNFDTSNVTDMSGMFATARTFNRPLDNFDTSKVTNMAGMFSAAISFDQDISSWDTSKVTDMTSMFAAAESFNQDISSWDVSNVTNMDGMFSNIVTPSAPFNQDLSQWCVTNITTEPENFALGLEAWTLPKPVWGTCPRGEDGSELPPVLGE